MFAYLLFFSRESKRVRISLISFELASSPRARITRSKREPPNALLTISDNKEDCVKKVLTLCPEWKEHETTLLQLAEPKF